MATKLPATDIIIIGLGWTGSIIAESMTKVGFNVVAIERGPWRDTAIDFPPNYAPDELRYAVRHDLMVRPAQDPRFGSRQSVRSKPSGSRSSSDVATRLVAPAARMPKIS